MFFFSQIDAVDISNDARIVGSGWIVVSCEQGEGGGSSGEGSRGGKRKEEKPSRVLVTEGRGLISWLAEKRESQTCCPKGSNTPWTICPTNSTSLCWHDPTGEESRRNTCTYWWALIIRLSLPASNFCCWFDQPRPYSIRRSALKARASKRIKVMAQPKHVTKKYDPAWV